VINSTQTKKDLQRTFEALHGKQPTNPAELRVLRKGTAPLSGCFTDSAAFAEAASQLDGDQRANLYVTLNPVIQRPPMNQDSVRRAGKGGAVGDGDIAELRWLFLDFDPERESDVPAADAEKAEAKLQMEQARAFFSELEWPEPLVADSGNGYHMLYPIDLLNDESSRQLVKAVAAIASQRFSTSEVKLDRSVSTRRGSRGCTER